LIKQNDQKQTPLNFFDHTNLYLISLRKNLCKKIIIKITGVAFKKKFSPVFRAVTLAGLDSNRDKIYLDSDIKKIAIILKSYIIH